MNKFKKEPSLKIKEWAFFSEKMNRYFWVFLLLLVSETVITLFYFQKFIRRFIRTEMIPFLKKIKV